MRIAGDLRRDLKSPEDDAELGNYNKYLALRDRLISGIDGTFHKPFTKPDDIWPELFAFFSQQHDARGYILEPKDTSDANILQIYASNEIVRDVVQRLGQFEYVDPRLSVSPEKKQALAQAFLQRHGDHIEQTYRTVFFESGCTVNYVAKYLSGVLPKKGMSHNIKRYPLVLTNNAFAYLYLWLCSGVMCHPEPDGPPDQKYGGMYGPLTNRDRVPDYTLPELREYDPDALTLIENLQSDMFGRIDGSEHSILLAAASGLQISDDITAVEARDPKLPYTREKILNQLQQCRGFHVGSYQNKLFKRCLYLSRTPAVVFLHDDKIDCPIQVGKCHFLFDRGETWESFIENHPVSIWVACKQSNYENVNEKLKSNLKLGDWSFKVYGDSTIYPIVIAHNAAFIDACTKISINI